MEKLPIVRIADWFARRRTLCGFCRKDLRQLIDGDDRYCSPYCREEDASMQANG